MLERLFSILIIVCASLAVQGAPAAPLRRYIDDGKQTQLFDACFAGETQLVRNLLTNEKVDVNLGYVDARHFSGRLTDRGTTCLMLATFTGRYDTVQALLQDFKANVNYRNDVGQTALHFASGLGSLLMVRLLCEEGQANLELKDIYGRNALINAAWRDAHDNAQYLLQRGAKVNERSLDGRTALQWATAADVRDLLRLYGSTM